MKEKMDIELNESTKRNRRRAVALFNEFICLCLNDIEHIQVPDECRTLVKRLVGGNENVVEELFMNYCRLESDKGGMVDKGNDLVIVIDSWTRCLYSNIGFDGKERDYYLPSTIQTFRQNLQAWSKQIVGRKWSEIIGAVFRASKTTMLKKQRRADKDITHVSGKNEKRGFHEHEIQQICKFLLKQQTYNLLLLINMFRHICCRTSSLLSISLRNCGLFDFDTERCCMNVRTEYTKGKGKMLSNNISVFADKTGLETCAIYSLALCLMTINPDTELTPDTKLVHVLFGNITKKELQRQFKEQFATVFDVSTADEVGFHSFRKYGATMLKSALMSDKDCERIINLRGGWAQEHSNEKGVQSIVSNSDVKSYYIAYNDIMDARAGKILARGYSTMPHLNPFFHFTWHHVANNYQLQKVMVKLFPRNVRQLVPHDMLINFAIFIVIGYAKGDYLPKQSSILDDPMLKDIIGVIETLPFDQPADFSQFTYESALRHDVISDYKLINGMLYRYNFSPPMECVSENIRTVVQKVETLTLSDSSDDELLTDEKLKIESIVEALKIIKPKKNDIDIIDGSDDEIARQKLKFTYDQVLSLWYNGKGNVPPISKWEIDGTLDRIKAESHSLLQRYKAITRQVENYNDLGLDGIIDALRSRGKPLTIDNAKIKLKK